MARLQIRFVTENDPISYFIRKETNFPYSHVEFVTDTDWVEYLVKVKKAVIPDIGTVGAHFSGGFMWRPIDYAKFVISELGYIECTDEQKEAVMKAAIAQLGAGYDVLEIAGIMFGKNWSTKGHWICSRVVASLVQLVGNLQMFNLLNDNALDSITPRDVYLSPLVKFAPTTVRTGMALTLRAQYMSHPQHNLNFDLGSQEYGNYVTAGTFAV